MMINRMLIAAAVVASSVGVAQASVVFFDDFSGYGSATVLNAPDSLFMGRWSTAQGTVDYLANGSGFGALCVGGGNCIDLDGSTGDAGVFFTTQTFGAGKYTLDISMFGNQRSGDESVTITLGTWSVTLGPFGVSDDVSNSWTFNTTGGGLSFSNAGGDNIGAILTEVKLSAVPLPASGLLLIGAMGGIAALRRRKSA